MHLTNAAEYASIILSCRTECIRHETNIVSAHRRILGMASVVCVSVKIYVSSISLYKLDPDKLTTCVHHLNQHINLPYYAQFQTPKPFLVVTTIHAQNHSFILTDFSYLTLFRAVFSLPGHSLPLLYTDLCLLQPSSRAFFLCVLSERFESAAVTVGTLP